MAVVGAMLDGKEGKVFDKTALPGVAVRESFSGAGRVPEKAELAKERVGLLLVRNWGVWNAELGKDLSRAADLAGPKLLDPPKGEIRAERPVEEEGREPKRARAGSKVLDRSGSSKRFSPVI